jgi:AcrR family transcriptional regulator
MPTDTFHNLPEAKRARLIEIAFEEFSANDFDTASISRIVARAGIAKGSIYQYFEDKRDVFLYLVDEASRTLLAAVTDRPPPDPDIRVFGLLRWQMSATVAAAAAHPLHARLLERVYTTGGPLAGEVAERGQAAAEAHFEAMVRAAVERGEIDRSLDPAVATFVLRAVTSEIGRFLTARFGVDGEPPDPATLSTPEVDVVFDQVVEILERGLGPRTR